MSAKNLALLCSFFYFLPGCAVSMDDRALHAQQLAEQNCYDQYYATLKEVEKSLSESQAGVIKSLRDMNIDESKRAELERKAIRLTEENARFGKDLAYRLELKQCIQRVRD